MSAFALRRASTTQTSADLLAMEEQLTAYWNAMALITANAHSITNAHLQNVDPGNEPAWFKTLSTNFTNCQSHAQMWIDTIYPNLTRLPQAILNYTTYFLLTTSRLSQLLQKLETRPPTPEEKATIVSLLELLVRKLGICKSEIEAVRADIKTFTQQMAADHKALTTGSASIQKAIEDSEKTIARLTARIDALRNEIQEMNQQITVAAAGLGISLLIGYIGLSVAPFIMIPIALIGIGVSIAAIVIATQKIQAAQEEILADSALLSKTQTQVVVLHAIAATVDDLVKSIERINTQIDVIASTWATLDVKLKAVIDNLKSAKDSDWADIISKEIDIAASQEAWKQLAEFAKKLQRNEVVEGDKQVHPIHRAA